MPRSSQSKLHWWWRWASFEEAHALITAPIPWAVLSQCPILNKSNHSEFCKPELNVLKDCLRQRTTAAEPFRRKTICALAKIFSAKLQQRTASTEDRVGRGSSKDQATEDRFDRGPRRQRIVKESISTKPRRQPVPRTPPPHTHAHLII